MEVHSVQGLFGSNLRNILYKTMEGIPTYLKNRKANQKCNFILSIPFNGSTKFFSLFFVFAFVVEV